MSITHLNPYPQDSSSTHKAETMPESVRLYATALAELDNWDDELTALNLALVDAALSRDRLSECGRQMEIEAARATFKTGASYAEARKAASILWLEEESATYPALVAQQRELRLKLADAERRAELSRQRCRLLREAVRLASSLEDEGEA